jgi:hypothetical protein
VEGYRYSSPPVWRIIALDGTLFVSTFDPEWEGHESPVYRLDSGVAGALHRGFTRMLESCFANAERFH